MSKTNGSGKYTNTFKVTDFDLTESNVIYLLSYEDGSRYIGSTKRELKKRLGEHHCEGSNVRHKTVVNKANSKAIKNNENVIVTIVRKVKDDENLKEVETKYITFYKDHSHCFNMNS